MACLYRDKVFQFLDNLHKDEERSGSMRCFKGISEMWMKTVTAGVWTLFTDSILCAVVRPSTLWLHITNRSKRSEKVFDMLFKEKNYKEKEKEDCIF